jgi:NifU-like domain
MMETPSQDWIELTQSSSIPESSFKASIIDPQNLHFLLESQKIVRRLNRRNFFNMFPSRLEILLVTAFFLSISTRGFLSLKINSRNTFRSYKIFTKSQASTFDFDMVRPAVEFDLSQVVLVSSFLEDYDADAKIQGVYAVQDVAGIVLYVGASMSMASDIGRLSKKLGSQIVNTLRIQTFPNPKPDAIDAYRFELIRQLSPSGNLENYEMWDDKQIIQGTTSQAVIATEKAGEKEKNSRERLADAVDGDSTKTVSDYVESPFVEGSSDSYIIGPNTSAGMEFTLENVDKVLDEVRPYLIADGGNVEVVSVDEFTRSVSLTLQGACGSCPSSTVRDEILLVIVCISRGRLQLTRTSCIPDYDEDGNRARS